MGVADGPTYAPAKPGSKPIVSEPCRCPECVAGPGLAVKIREDEARLERVLGPITRVVIRDWCPTCEGTVQVTSTRSGPGWINICENYHSWRSYE